jgi:hypothetical protein
MTMIQIRSRSDITADTDYVSPVVPINGTLDARIRLNPDAAFDDLTLRITITVKLSMDGGATWPHETIGTIVGGARGKDGLMPSVGFGLCDSSGNIVMPENARLQAIYRQNKTIPMGLQVDIL